jgi:hydrogenase 3 maturation protease
MRSDDGIGSIIAEEITTEESTNLIIYDAETTPENYIDKVVEAKPDWVIFVDACNFGAKPGEFKMFNDGEIEEISYGLLSTHTLPLTLTIELIKKQHNCKISLIGIQPKSFIMGTDLSPELIHAKRKVIKHIKSIVK